MTADINTKQQQPQSNTTTTNSTTVPLTIIDWFESILYWHSIPLSSIVCLIGIIYYILIRILHYSSITLFSYLILLQLTIAFITININRILDRNTNNHNNNSNNNTNTNTNIDPYYEYLNPNKFTTTIQLLITRINHLLSALTMIINCESNSKTLFTILIFLLLSIIGRIIEFTDLLLLLWLSLFTIPVFYNQISAVIYTIINQIKLKLLSKFENSID